MSARSTATQYANKMELAEAKQDLLVNLAHRFDDKEFLPSFSDIDFFFDTYDINKLSSKSRVAAIPRVFNALADMSVDEIQFIAECGQFSGPARLGPIADAIRSAGQSRG